jgi:hypothetical protein
MPLRPHRASAHKDVNKRMVMEGRWEEYCLRRTQLKRDGVEDRIAWRIICNLMPPLDGTPPEARVTADLEPIVTKYIESPPEIPLQPAMGAGEGFLDVQAGLAEAARTESNDAFVAEIKTAKADWHSEWDLLWQRVDPKRVAPEAEVVRWVFNNAGTKPNLIQPEDVPSLGALKYLQHVQASYVNYSDFVKTNWSKMLPDKKALEYESNRADDGRRQLKALDDLIDSLDLELDKEVDGDDGR